MGEFRRLAALMWAASALSLASATCSSESGEVATSLNIVNAEMAPDGFRRSVTVANGTLPGPLISANVGDRFLINVTDSLSDASMYRATTIHWHGLYQMTTPEMDGVDAVSQCPIIPGNSYLYNFTAPGQSGTYWYHSHISTQLCDGVTGALVIYDPEDPLGHLYDVDDESTIINLRDWLHDVSTVSHPVLGGAPPTTNATLINGLGRYSGGPSVDLAVVRAQPGMRHRMRFVNTGCNDYYDVSIDDHKLTIIEVDGVETIPYEVDQFRMQPGQRYSAIVEMNQPVDNYWIRANPLLTNDTTNGINSAILRYDGAPVSEPPDRYVNASLGVVMEENKVQSLINPSAPGEPYENGADIVLNLKVNATAAGAWAINDVAFIPPSVPVLLQILSGSTSANSLLPLGSVYDLPANKVVEVHITNEVGVMHPFHLHGANFYLVKPGGSQTYNFENPVQRDVAATTTDIGDEVVLRFVTTNTGPWILHCHIDWHLQDGLAVVFALDSRDVSTIDPPTQEWEDLCPSFNANNPDTAFLSLTSENAY